MKCLLRTHHNNDSSYPVKGLVLRCNDHISYLMRCFTLLFFLTIISIEDKVQAQAPVALPVPYSTASKVNFVRTYHVLAPISDPSQVPTRAFKDVQQVTQYVDGLGRPIQTVVKHGSLVTNTGAARDLVTAQVYDEFGRESYQYLPFASDSSNGNFKLNPFQQQKDFYNSFLSGQSGETNVGTNGLNWAYSKTIYEASPLNRVKAVYAPGSSWVGSESGATKRSSSIKYWFNKASDSVRVWSVVDTAGKMGGYASAGIYPAGKLFKNVTIDEHGKQVIEFKGSEGQVILKKVQLTATADTGSGKNHQGWLCTYYIYDDFNQLRAVIQPVAVERMATAISWTLTATELAEQVFRYAYDGKRRMTMKKVPGAAVVYMVYDKWDRLVLTQDGNQRAGRQWLFTKYDALNRPILTGFYTHAVVLAQDTMQRYLYAQNLGRFETYQTASFPLYTVNLSFPVVNFNNDVNTITYYDDHSWTDWYGNYRHLDTTYKNKFLAPSNTTYPYPQPLVQSTATRGMVTGTWDKGGPGVLTSFIYDEKGRVIQTKQYNLTGGMDITTTQYDFSGKPLKTLYKQDKAGSPAQISLIWTSYEYDDLGRVLKVRKKVDTKLEGVTDTVKAAEVVLVQNEYDALGQVKSQKLGQQKSIAGTYSTDPVETLSYAYNIRGWLLGVNRDEMLTANGTGSRYFGFELGYDKSTNKAARNYLDSMYNGNISGMIWKSRSDGTRRKYDFGYDAANRLLRGTFEQNDGGSTWGTATMDFSTRMGDGTTATSAYDANGNIKWMTNWGMTVNGKTKIDSLQYVYYAGTNKLSRVGDQVTASLNLGDFTDGNTGSDDYGYDLNGNMITDMNKGLRGTTGLDKTSGNSVFYNYLGLVDSVIVKLPNNTVKGTIRYLYQHNGQKYLKRVRDLSVSGKTVTTTTHYMGGSVFESRTTVPTDTNNPDYAYRLQFIGHEEGRIRFVQGMSPNPSRYVYDYFVKDHLGNVRMVLTEEEQRDIYPIATLEGSKSSATSSIGRAKLFYDIDTSKIVLRNQATNIPNYENNNAPLFTNQATADSAQNSQQLYKLIALNNTGVTGLGMTLKVMGGDKVSVYGTSYYHDANTGGTNYDVPLLDLLNGMIGNPLGGAAGKGVTGSTLNGITSIASAVQAFRDDPNRDPSTSTVPKASLNWILFDEQFKPVTGTMGFKRVTTANTLEDLKQLQIEIPKNGYLYVYCSNESPTAVFFDNIQVVHDRSRILEETHYYPFGLTMAGISSKAATTLENRYKFNAGTELNSDFDLNLYETPFRGYDPQIGRFNQVDALAEKFRGWTPYAFAFNNPITYNDPLGLESLDDFVRKALAGYGGSWRNDGKGNGGGSSFYYGPGADGNTLANVDVWRKRNSRGGYDTRWSDVNRQLQNNGFQGFNIDEMKWGAVADYKDISFPGISQEAMATAQYYSSSQYYKDRDAQYKASWPYRSTGAIDQVDLTDFIPTKGAGKLSLSIIAAGLKKGGSNSAYSLTAKAVRTALGDRTGKRGFTEVGYQFQKHAGREGGEFWKAALPQGAVLNPATYNQAGYNMFKEIWKAPGSFQNVGGFIEKRLPDGRGIRLQGNFEFKGFID